MKMFNKHDISRDECQLRGGQAKKDTTGGGIHSPHITKRLEKQSHFSWNSLRVILNLAPMNLSLAN